MPENRDAAKGRHYVLSRGEARMSTTSTVTGEFEVKMSPQPQDGGAEGPGRMLLDKRYRGPLEATSTGRMLAVRTAVEGSAGYVAIEVVTGTLQGRSGSFALQHSGTMDRGRPSLTVTVI